MPSLLSSVILVQIAPGTRESKEHMFWELLEESAGWREAAREASMQVPLCIVGALSWRFCRSCKVSTGDATANETSSASHLTVGSPGGAQEGLMDGPLEMLWDQVHLPFPIQRAQGCARLGEVCTSHYVLLQSLCFSKPPCGPVPPGAG